MAERKSSVSFFDVLFSTLCFVYVWILVHYALFMWESRQRYGIIFLTMTLMLAALGLVKKKSVLGLKGNGRLILSSVFFALAFGVGIYFWVEYPSLVWERAGFINNLDIMASGIVIYLVIQLTWITSGPVIPIVTLFFIAYAMFGHWVPWSFFYHPPISFTRFMELSCAEINGIFGTLNQIGATWIAIFAFFAGFVQGFGGLDFVLQLTSRLVGRRKTNMPQVAVLASMGFGGMSGSAGANAISTGAFTIPIMKRFGMPPAIAGAVESVASSGGQIMPPILGAVAFVMCDYLNKYYYQIILASLFPSIIYFGSTMLSVYFLAKRFIDPNREIEMPPEFKEKMGFTDLIQGVPIAVSLFILLYVFIVYKVNILIGGFYTLTAFLVCRFVYEVFVARGRLAFIQSFLKGVYKGTLRGTSMMIPIGAMLGALGIVIRVLTTTGLAEKISFYTVSIFGANLFILLFFIMIICILFGMAVTTVAAYILVVTLASPALMKVGIDPLVAHFSVFYWAMLSAITPPVAAVCVVTSGIANANFMKTAWESMKLGAQMFILPFIFVMEPGILSFSSKGIVPFIISSIGFLALAAGIQSRWGWWQQLLLIVLSVAIFLPLALTYKLFFAGITLIALLILWKRYADKVKPAPMLMEV